MTRLLLRSAFKHLPAAAYFTDERKQVFNQMILEQPAEIRGMFSSLPGGAVLQQYVDELEEKTVWFAVRPMQHRRLIMKKRPGPKFWQRLWLKQITSITLPLRILRPKRHRLRLRQPQKPRPGLRQKLRPR